MQLTAHHRGLDVLHENTLASRAYYIPVSPQLAASRKNYQRNFNLERELSDRFQLLNGKWQFGYYPNGERARGVLFAGEPHAARHDAGSRRLAA